MADEPPKKKQKPSPPSLADLQVLGRILAGSNIKHLGTQRGRCETGFLLTSGTRIQIRDISWSWDESTQGFTKMKLPAEGLSAEDREELLEYNRLKTEDEAHEAEEDEAREAKIEKALGKTPRRVIFSVTVADRSCRRNRRTVKDLDEIADAGTYFSDADGGLLEGPVILRSWHTKEKALVKPLRSGYDGLDWYRFQSPILQSPTWLEVAVQANRMLLSREPAHHVFLETVFMDKEATARRKDGTRVFVMAFGS